LSQFFITKRTTSHLSNRQYEYLGITVPSYGLRNENRLPTYHHLDIAATLTPRKNNEKLENRMGFSIYNLYNRKNAASISFRENADTVTKVRTSILVIVLR
jgi:hypothetical protein